MEGIRMKSMTKKKKDQPTNGRQATAAADAGMRSLQLEFEQAVGLSQATTLAWR
jgi:hypothetical protein